MLKTILVRAGDIPVKREYKDFSELLVELKIANGNWETNTVNDGEGEFRGIGVVSRDQDKAGKRKVNILGLKGDSIIVGMERPLGDGEPDQINNPHVFASLTAEQENLMFKRLVRQSLFSKSW